MTWTQFVLRFGVSALFTGLTYVIAIWIADRRFRPWPSSLIGFVVVFLGYVAATLRAPIWVVIALPVPVGFAMLYHVLRRELRRTLTAYFSGWAIYAIFHVLLSSIFHYDSLIPGWRLHR